MLETMSLNSGGGGATIHEPTLPSTSSSESASMGGGSCVSDTALCAWASDLARFAAIIAACLRVNELFRWKPMKGGLGLSSPLRASSVDTIFFGTTFSGCFT